MREANPNRFTRLYTISIYMCLYGNYALFCITFFQYLHTYISFVPWWTVSNVWWAWTCAVCASLSLRASCLCCDSMGSSKGWPDESQAGGCHPSRKTGEYGGTETLRCKLVKKKKKGGGVLDQHGPLTKHDWHNTYSKIKHADQSEVQLGPNKVQSSFSSVVRCSWSSETAPLVKAGLSTDIPNSGPPVVFTIYERQSH